jgi:hypothetical protein
MAQALKNAIIVSEDGPDFKWRERCDECGTVESGTQGDRITGSEGLRSSFHCDTCNERRHVEIRAVPDPR